MKDHDCNWISNIDSAIEEIKDHYEGIIEQLPEHIYWKDINGVILGCNDLQAQSVGLKTAKDMVGLTAYDTLPIDQADEITRIDQYVISTGKPIITEEISNIAGGEQRIYLSRKVPLIHKKSKKIVGILGISVDITELKNTQDKLKKAEGRLDGMLVLSSSMAHELRTPLAAINITATNLKRQLPTLIAGYKKSKNNKDEDCISDRQLKLISESIDIILNATKNSHQFINMILKNVMFEENHIGKDNECFIKKCIESSIAEYAFPIGDREKIDLTGIEDFKFYGDENLIKHVFFNLLKNALYFIEKAGKGEIRIWSDQNNNYNQVYFEDTGWGISKEKLPRIFDRFFTADTHHGTGVGLAFCKLVMEAIDGSIQCESEQNRYTRFILNFPKVK